MAWNFEHFSVLTIIFTINFYFSKFLLVFSFSCFLFSRTFLLCLSLSSLIGLSCFRKVKWKMQFILCFLKSASKSLRSQSLNFPLFSCYCHRNIMSLYPLFVYIPKKLCPSKPLFVYITETLWPSYPMFVYKTETFFPSIPLPFPLLLFWFCNRKWRLLEGGT